MTATATPELTTDGRDLVLEHWLDDHHVQWTYDPALDLATVDVTKSLANQARVSEPLIEDVVDRYRADYERGDRFPPIIVRRTSPRAKKVVVLGGNHRRAGAAAAGVATHPAYVVECTDELALTIMYDDNRRHGMPPTKAERCAQGAHLIDNGWSQAEAAAQVGVSQPTLSNYLNVARTARRAKSLQVARPWDTLTTGTKEALARIPADPVFVEAVKVAAAAEFTAAETNAMVQQIRKARSEADALATVAAALDTNRARIQTARAKGRHTGKGAESAYGAVNTALMKILDVAPDRLVAPDPTAAKRMRDTLRRALDRMVEFDRVLKS